MTYSFYLTPEQMPCVGTPITHEDPVFQWAEDIDVYIDGVQLETVEYSAVLRTGVFTVNLPYTEPSGDIRTVTIYHKRQVYSHGQESYYKQVLAIQNGTSTVHFGYPVGFGDTYTCDKETGLPEISAHAGREKGEQEFEL